MRRRFKKLRKVRQSTHSKSSFWKEIISKLLKEKNFVVSIIGAIITLSTFLFIYFTYESSPDVKCEIGLIQRPDSLYQAQLHIWNEGDKIAENIIIWAKKEEVFLYDTSGNYKKGRLNIFPHFNVYIKIKDKYLDDAAKVKQVINHQIIIPKLFSSAKEDNYLIIGPNVGKNEEELKKLKTSPTSIYRFKYIELGKAPNIKSYQEEILNNVQVIFNGIKIKIKVGDTVHYDEIDKTKFYFPTFKEFDEYKKQANLPDQLIPPFELEEKMIKKKKDDEEDDNGFLLF